jgi:protein required for attachment to host cells
MVKLVSITASPKADKKLMAVFDNDGRKKTVHFGAKTYTDYTMTSGSKEDKEMRDRYRTRHAKDLQTSDPTRAGFLSYYVLWGDSTSRATNISAYKRKFNL